MAAVSVIIPVYNTEKYLRRCLDSVCNQTLKDLEIICIDDASPDASASILSEYAARDARIRVLTFDENRGAAAARNAALEIACGEYVAFVDSDDWPEIDFYERLILAANRDNSDIAKGDYRYQSNSSFAARHDNDQIREDKNMFSYGYCSAVFRRATIGELRFPQLIDMEDPVFAFSVALRANRVSVVDECYINITRRCDSQTAAPPTIARVTDRINGLCLMIGIANSSNQISEVCYVRTLVDWTALVFESLQLAEKETVLFAFGQLRKALDRVRFKQEFANRFKMVDRSAFDVLLDQNQDAITATIRKWKVCRLIRNHRGEAIV